MAIKTVAVISSQLFLGDLYDKVKELEDEGGECPQNERVWVMIRQATESDTAQVAEMRSKTVVRWVSDGAERGSIPEEVRDDNPRLLWAWQVYLTLHDAGNLFDDDETPLFEFESKGPYNRVKGGFDKFMKSYGKLPAPVATSLLMAVGSINPGWGILAQGEADEEP
jgi:hypothetical protein